jgi:hypothetical protein
MKKVEILGFGLLIIAVVLNLYYIGKRIVTKEPAQLDGRSYQIDIIDDSLKVYDAERVVGTVKLQGQLDSLITEDNR